MRTLRRALPGIALCLTLLLSACQRGSGGSDGPVPGASGASTAPDPATTVQLLFTYGSEKEDWIKDVTASFNASGTKTPEGKRILVEAVPQGSGESIDDILSGTRKPHLTSPASAAFLRIGNAQSRTKTGKDLVGETRNLVLSPVVIALWKPMAEAIGWGRQPVGWSNILSLAQNPQGWASLGHPEWGAFRLGHTHPEYSNSGLISLLAEAYAGAGKLAGLTLKDVADPKTARYVAGIESSIVHYGSSTGFFGKRMFTSGPQYLSAAVLYESSVIESYSPQYHLPFPVVAVYPKEGTFWSDHPVGIVEREWVTPEHRAAAKIYVDYLLARPQQERAMQYGFRPSAVEIPLGAPFDAAHGVDPKEPQTTLEVPPAEVIDAVRKLWHEQKKRSDLTLVLDVSGSMNDDQKLINARSGAQQLVALLDDEDTFSFLPFNNQLTWAARDLPLARSRQRVLDQIGGVFAAAGTALYDAIAAAYDSHLQKAKSDAGRISAIVVLTDGDDTDSKMRLEELLGKIRADAEHGGIRVFTIGYGKDANRKVLEAIAEASQAKFYAGTPENIRTVFREISTFF